MSEQGRKLNELRVSDLKEELENRNLDTLGPKATLVERLEKAIRNEGKDPWKHVFVSAHKASFKKEPISPVKATNKEVRVKDEPLDDENGYGTYEDGDNRVDQVGDVDEECFIIDDDDERDEDEIFNNTVEDEGVGNENGEVQADVADEEEEDQEDIQGEVETEVDEKESNNQDQEESINLTIGEDEQQLLHDEASIEKEKTAVAKQKDKGAATNKKIVKITKAVSSSNNSSTKALSTNNSSSSINNKKEEKKPVKGQEEAIKTNTKKDDKTSDKKEDSEQKSSATTKTSHKDNDDKEKSSSSATATTSATTIAVTGGSAIATGGNSAKLLPPVGKSTGPSRNLWVSGLSALTRASDLKTIFSKYGKVIGAKVVTNTRTPGTRCYGYVTMSSSNDASRCIENLHRTELHGRIISVERTKNEIGSSTARSVNAVEPKKIDEEKKSQTHISRGDYHHQSRSHHRDERHTNDSRKRDDTKRNDAKRDGKDITKQEDREKEKIEINGKGVNKPRSVTSRRRTSRSTDRQRSERYRERDGPSYSKIRDDRERQRQREILSYQKIREERERQRLRERERELREEERRRREIRERQRQEEQRLTEERKKLALERERLEREKAELIRLERERQKLEREKIELERLELKRQQMKIIQTRAEPVKQRVSKRSNDDRYTEATERKRSTATEARFEAPPPPRFDASLVPSRSYEKKREDYGSSSVVTKHDFSASSNKRMEYATSGSKRSAIEDYATVPTKRNTSDYITTSSSKRAIDVYAPSSKRADDYTSSKSARVEYKREVEIRHVPSTSSLGTSFHSSSLHKSNRYSGGGGGDAERTSTSNYRRGGGGGMDDVRTSGGSKRYESSSGGFGSGSAWPPSVSHMVGGGSGGGYQSTVKSYVGNGTSSSLHNSSSSWQKSAPVEGSNWRPVQSQDRYDRTYNERSSGYPSGGGGGSGGIYASSSRGAQERNTSGRY